MSGNLDKKAVQLRCAVTPVHAVFKMVMIRFSVKRFRFAGFSSGSRLKQDEFQSNIAGHYRLFPNKAQTV